MDALALARAAMAKGSESFWAAFFSFWQKDVPDLLKLLAKSLSKAKLPKSVGDVERFTMADWLAAAPILAGIMLCIATPLALLLGERSGAAPAKGDLRRSYVLTREALLRGMGLCYGCGFLVSAIQHRALWGSLGLLPHGWNPHGRPAPAFEFMDRMGWGYGDWQLELVSWLGVALAVQLMFGRVRTFLVPLALWALYLSIVNLSAPFTFSYGWEWLTCEARLAAMIPSLGESARQASHTEPTPPAGQGRTKGGGKGDAGGRGGAHAADDPRPTPQAASDGPQASPRTSAARALRQELQIAIEEDPYGDCPVPIASFDEAEGLPRYVMNNLARAGITGPLPIQAQALPLILTGRDVIGLAQTGSGKTLAFLLPIATHIKSWPRGVNTHALVLAPTRELSVQIFDEAQKVFDTRAADWTAKKVFCACVYGGDGRRWQEQQLTKGAHIIVATPGRLIDFIRSGAAVLDQVSYFVLDEADRMLDMGFSGDVASISATLDPGRQMLFFSATWNKQVQELARGLCRKGSQPVRISYGQRGCRETDGGDEKRMAREGIVQEVITVDYPPSRDRWNLQAAEKRRLLNEHVASALAASPEHKVLIFVSQKNVADDLKEELSDDGIAADSMHGGKQQSYRLWVLDQFRKGNLRVLVCTDVLGRGIDIPSVSHVVIHDMGDLQDYIHRIGRTARGKYGRGHALVFFEYWAPMPHLAGELIEVLEESKQPVPEDLRRIADEVLAGERPVERMPWRRVLAAEKAKAAKANQHGWD